MAAVERAFQWPHARACDPGPHERDGFTLTRWDDVDVADDANPDSAAAGHRLGAPALRQVHDPEVLTLMLDIRILQGVAWGLVVGPSDANDPRPTRRLAWLRDQPD